MKLIKLCPMVVLVFTMSVTAALAETGKVPAEQVDHMCEKLAASLIKKDGKPVVVVPASTRDEKHSPAIGAPAI